MLPNGNSVHPYFKNAIGGNIRSLESCPVDDGPRIKQDKISMAAFRKTPTVPQSESKSGQARHLPYRFLQREDSKFTTIPAEHTRKGSPQTGMGVGVMGQAIRTDHT